MSGGVTSDLQNMSPMSGVTPVTCVCVCVCVCVCSLANAYSQDPTAGLRIAYCSTVGLCIAYPKTAL